MRFAKFEVLAGGQLVGRNGEKIPEGFIKDCEALTQANMREIYEEVGWENPRSRKIGYCEESKLAELKQPGVFLCALKDETDELLGFVKISAIDRVTTFVMELQVAKEHAGRGIGKALMENAERLSCTQFHAKRMQLCVQINNVAAQGFYEHLKYSVYLQDSKFLLFSKRIARK